LGGRLIRRSEPLWTDRGKAPVGRTGILYDAFHPIALLMHRKSVALRECALTENASAHGGRHFRIHGVHTEKTCAADPDVRSARKSGLS
jgi:hypothetical protein